MTGRCRCGDEPGASGPGSLGDSYTVTESVPLRKAAAAAAVKDMASVSAGTGGMGMYYGGNPGANLSQGGSTTPSRVISFWTAPGTGGGGADPGDGIAAFANGPNRKCKLVGVSVCRCGNAAVHERDHCEPLITPSLPSSTCLETAAPAPGCFPLFFSGWCVFIFVLVSDLVCLSLAQLHRPFLTQNLLNCFVGMSIPNHARWDGHTVFRSRHLLKGLDL